MKTTDLETSRALADALEGAGYVFGTKSRHVPHQEIMSLNEYVLWLWENDSNRIGTPLSSNMEDVHEWHYRFPPAFTMCELWGMLPNKVNVGHFGRAEKRLTAINDAHYYCTNAGKKFIAKFFDENKCNALAKLVMWCIENNHHLNLKKNSYVYKNR